MIPTEGPGHGFRMEHYANARKALDDLAAPGKRLIQPQQIAKAISDHAEEDARLHLRCRPADGMSRALLGGERQGPAPRVVLARLDGGFTVQDRTKSRAASPRR
jgi:hypothetical protein